MNQDNNVARLEEEVRVLKEQLKQEQEKNNELHSERVSKTQKLTDSQDNLLSLSRRQALFIKVLQILQLEDDFPKAMGMALAEIGEYTGVDRMQVWENNSDGITYGVSYEWCNTGIEPSMHYLRNVPLEYGKPWFDMLLSERIICTWDISTLHPAMIEILKPQGVQSIVVIPLAEYGNMFGYLSFTVTEARVWENEEIDLLKNIAQIVSTVTKRSKAEMFTQQSQQVMRTVLDNISANIFVLDTETEVILFANKSFRQEIGENPEGLICWQSFKAGRTKSCDHCPKKSLFNNKKRPTGEIVQWEDYNSQTKRWYNVSSVGLEWVDGRTVVMELAADITNRKMGELELISAKKKAEESDRLKSSFLANMSHEIRTPLNAIMGYSQLLSRKTYSEDKQKLFLDDIQKNSTQLLAIIEDVLDISKIESDQLNLSYLWINLNQLVQDVNDALKFQIGDKNVSLFNQKSLPDSQVYIYVDDVRLKQILSNLVSNAIKFTEQGFVHFGYTLRDDNMLEFFVKDTGVGIAQEKIENVFEQFRQEDESTTRKFGGTGLGLTISKRLVELMGGKIWVESEKEKGSQFFFDIPYVAQSIDPANTPTIAPYEDLDEMLASLSGNILVVDDHDSSYVLISEFFADCNITVEYRNSGRDAITYMETNPQVSLIFMDIHMPGLNGTETMKAIKAMQSEIPIVAQTAFALKEDKKKFLTSGFDDYVPKPLTNENLQRVVNRFLKEKKN